MAEWSDRTLAVGGAGAPVPARAPLREHVWEQQRSIVTQMAAGRPMAETLDALCAYVESEFPGVFCSVLLLDRVAGVLHHGAAPSLPPDYVDMTDRLPARDGFGSCGTAAARGETVIVEDVETDPLFDGYVELLRSHGLRSVWSQPLVDVGGEVIGTLALYRREVSRPTAAERDLVCGIAAMAALAIERDSVHRTVPEAVNVDRTTGLPNRARFLNVVNESMRCGERPTIMFLEVDRFRQVDDSHMQLAGGRVLAAIASRLNDTFGDDALVARFTEEGFALALRPDVMSDEEFAARALAAFDAPVFVDGGEFFLLATVGIIHANGDDDAYGLIRDAAAAMHVARTEGSGRMRVYDSRLREQMIAEIADQAALRRAISAGDLVVHYQPILDVKQRAWNKLEALVRWEDPERGPISPVEFIPLAERTGLIAPLGQQVLEMVIAQMQEWSRSFPDLQTAVNVSIMQLTIPSFAGDLLGMLERAGLPPKTIILEVTESALMKELDTIKMVLADLRAAGMRVSLDDFGTGYSSLARLAELPITALKLDRAFVARLSTDPATASIVRATAEIARAHGLGTVAEGIEDAETLQAVAALGCGFAQGFYLARPLTPEKTFKVLSEPVAPELLEAINAGVRAR